MTYETAGGADAATGTTRSGDDGVVGAGVTRGEDVGVGLTDADRASRSGYRGPDRRAVVDTAAAQRSRWLPGATLLTVVLVCGARSLAAVGWLDSGRLVPDLHVGVVALSLVLVPTALLAWRVTGERRAGHLATIGATFGGAALVDVLGAAGTTGRLRDALILAGAAAAWRAVRGPDVDTGASARRELAASAATVLTLWVFAATVPLGRTADLALLAVTAAVWVATWGVARRSATPRTGELQRRVTWTTAVCACAELTQLAALCWPGRGVRTAAVLLVLCALASAAAAVVVALATAATSGRVRVLRAVEDDRRRESARRREAADRAHEVRGALVAIEGATLTLERHRDQLTPELRTELASAVVEELAALRSLLEVPGRGTPPGPDVPSTVPGRAPEAVTGGDDAAGGAIAPVLDRPATTARRFRPADVVREQVALGRARGLAIVDVGCSPVEAIGDAAAFGRVVANLVRNAERHGGGADGGRVEVAVAGRGSRVLVSVRDHGPGIPAGREAAIFERGVQLGGPGSGDGLGLHLARHLTRDLGGDLRVERPGGAGARFVVDLPRADVEGHLSTRPVTGTRAAPSRRVSSTAPSAHASRGRRPARSSTSGTV